MLFVHNCQTFKTETHQDAGKHAEFDDVFKLVDLDKPVQNNEQIIFEAFDEDVDADDLLGKTEPIPYATFVQSEEK